LFARTGWLSLVFVLGEHVGQAVEATLPESAALGEPPFREAQAARVQATGPHAADLLGSYDAALFEDLEVLYDRGQGDAERLRQIADRHGSTAQSLDQGTTSGLGQGVEDAIDRGIV
jgi:hypothetical protein